MYKNFTLDPQNTSLRVMEYVFLIGMTIELALKACAHGLIFTPDAIFASCGGVIDLVIYLSALAFLILPKEDPMNEQSR